MNPIWKYSKFKAIEQITKNRTWTETHHYSIDSFLSAKISLHCLPFGDKLSPIAPSILSLSGNHPREAHTPVLFWSWNTRPFVAAGSSSHKNMAASFDRWLIIGILTFCSIVTCLSETYTFDQNIGVAYEFKIHVDAGKEECFSQYVHPGSTFYVAFQVGRKLSGSWMKCHNATCVCQRTWCVIIKYLLMKSF